MKKIYAPLPELQEILFYELQSGFYVISVDAVNIRSFLKDFCRIDEQYIKNKIKTIFPMEILLIISIV
jgi:hypothetical protein